MIIDTVEIENFRSVKHAVLNCTGNTSIVGRNGCGKSTLLKAIDIFYNVAYQATNYDYFAKDTSLEIAIRVRFVDLRRAELDAFQPYIADESLTVVKKINAGGAKYFGAARQIAQFAAIRPLGATPKRTALNALIERRELPGLEGRANSEAQATEIMDAYEREHPEQTVLLDREAQFMGAKNVGAGSIDNFTKFVLIPAVRDASLEIDRKGIINQLIDVLVARSVEARPDVRALNEEFARRVAEVYSRDNLGELAALADTISRILEQYAPNAKLGLEFGDIVLPKIQMPSAIASLVEDDFSSPISYSGHGVQRALVLALLQQLTLTDLAPVAAQSAKVAGEQVPNGDAEPKGGAAATVSMTPDLILAIEEPELYLHPQKARRLSSVLASLALRPTEIERARTQVIYCTHSPYFVGMDRFDEIRLARKRQFDDASPLECTLSEYSLSEAASRLSGISAKDPASFTAGSFFVRAGPVMTELVSEGFFADAVVIVEGAGDVGALWAIQEILNLGWDSFGISILPAQGKNNIDKPVVVFSGLDIPTYFLFDADASLTKEDDRVSAARANVLLQRLGNVANPADFPLTQVNATWASFSDKLESEVRAAVGEGAFDAARHRVATKFEIPETKGLLKNPHTSAEVIREIYAAGGSIAVLENIARAVSALAA